MQDANIFPVQAASAVDRRESCSRRTFSVVRTEEISFPLRSVHRPAALPVGESAGALRRYRPSGRRG